jgi:hypothetical protein
MTASLQDQIAAVYDQLAEEIAVLGDQMEAVGNRDKTLLFREYAYVAWRAGRAEHVDPEPNELRPCACRECWFYKLVGPKGMPSLESFTGIGRP